MAEIAVGAVVFDDHGRVLVVRRDHPPREGEWSLIGGRPEPGESLEDAIVREVFEEARLNVRVVCALDVVRITSEGFVYDIHEFLCATVDVAIARAASDAREVAWVAVSDLQRIGIREDARAVVASALARSK